MDPFMEQLNMGAVFMMLMTYAALCNINIETSGPDWWVFPRQQVDWNVIQGQVWRLCPSLLNEKWLQYYRMPYETYMQLVQDLAPFVERANTNFRACIPIDKAVAMVLYRLATGYSPKHVADKYGVGATTVREYTEAICAALADPQKLMRRYISTPTGATLRRIIAEFKELTNIDNMCGAIDGSHIKLSKKPDIRFTPADYWSRHDFHSILLQGVCDANKLFWDVCVKAPGGTHDATHLSDSSLWRKLKSHDILQEQVKVIQGQDIFPYLVGDSAYPLQAQLLKAFHNRATGSMDQNRFDKAIRRGRVKIENAFGMLKQRWRILRELNVGLSAAPDVIVACTVLHNICVLARVGCGVEDPIDPHPNAAAEENNEPVDASEARSKRIGSVRRDSLLVDFVARGL
jgi:hypothetical protein